MQSDFDIPIIQAPMAGGITTPELVAAVSNSGALGSLGAGYMFPDEIRIAIQRIKKLTDKPFNVNLFVPEKSKRVEDLSSFTKILTSIWNELSEEPFRVPSPLSIPPFDEQLQVLLEEKVPVFSFTFGILPSSTIEQFKQKNIRVFGTATTPVEAQQLEQTGIDAVICQGQEAGGHRGNFSSHDPFYSLFPLLMLTKQKVKIPLIAAGGIMNGCAAKAALLAGATAVQLGTAFLTTLESGAHPIYKQALLEGKEPTKLTRAFTGKNARAIMNQFMQRLSDSPLPPYPVQHFLTQQIRSLAAKQNRADFMSLWAGQGYPLCQKIPAAQLIQQIFDDLSR